MKNTTPYWNRDLDALQARFALRVAARLTERAQDTPQDVAERLRFAREQALERARHARSVVLETASVAQPAGRNVAALLFGGRSSWWIRLASVVPLVMLLGGLTAIEELHDKTQIDAAAEIDVALLSDKLPPDAYRDAGFVEYLKTAEE